MPKPFCFRAEGQAGDRGLFRQRGAILPVLVTVPDLVANRQGFAPFCRITALIDTGASGTCISKKVAETLNLKEQGQARMGGAYGDTEKRSYYAVNFQFGDVKFFITDHIVFEADLKKTPYDMLIGRDILFDSLFKYDGFTAKFSLEIPSPSDPSHPDHADNKSRPLSRPIGANQKIDGVKRKQKRKMQRNARKRNR